MSLNDYWRGVIEAGPIEPPLLTVAYKMAEAEFNVDMFSWELGERLRPSIERLGAQITAAFAKWEAA